MLPLLATLLVAHPLFDTARASAAVSPAPAIQITLNSGGNYLPGGLVNVRVETNDDGYLIVFRVDGDGRIRVLFPLDPDGDAFVRGGKEYELRGRGDRATFLADDRGGSGMVYAAIARQSYNTRDFTANGHWDYDALRLPDSTTDAENDLTAIVARMTNRVRFDYDAVGYRVQDIPIAGSVPGVGGYYPGFYDPFYNPRWRCLSCGWGYPGADLSIGFGYSPFWDPWLYSPWGYNYGYGFGYGYTGRNWWYGGNYPVVINPRPIPVLPPGTRSRPRAAPAPQGGFNGSGGPPRPATSAPPPPTGRSNPPPPSGVGTRARQRPSDLTETPPSRNTPQSPPSVRPVFRQPQTEPSAPPRQDSPRSRPVYREPPQQQPQANRAPPPPPPAPRAGPPSSSPPARSTPPPASTTSRPRGGGGGH